MQSRRLKTGYFVIEGLNSFSSVYYLYYFYFFMQQQFGYDNQANLVLAALNGAVYAFFAWLGGRFAQHYGYFTSLKLGFVTMIAALLAGSQVGAAAAQVLVMAVTVAGLCFTWPALEGLISEGESSAGVQRMVGLYNVVWAGTGAVSYFIGGALIERFGMRSLFFIPAAIISVQLLLILGIEIGTRRAIREAIDGRGVYIAPSATMLSGEGAPAAEGPVRRPRSRNFLRMAWLANPFAYIAINTVIAVIPGLAHQLHLSTMVAGYCCSLWCFARLVAFAALWAWTGWHYRFRWMLAAYVALVLTFTVMLMVPHLGALIAAQIVFGAALGLIYYSSLFYSMDLSDTKGEHGGIHEAAIGVGNFTGPAIGAVTLYLVPQWANSGTLAVSGLLLLGLGGLTALWKMGKG